MNLKIILQYIIDIYIAFAFAIYLEMWIDAQLIQFASSFHNKFMVTQLNMYKLDINLLKGVITKK